MTKPVGPGRKPQEFGFKPGDTHLIVNDITETAKAYDFYGNLLWEVPALARGQGSDYVFSSYASDTVPGLYRLGAVYDDYGTYGAYPSFDRTLMAYGWMSFDMVELEGQEARYGRAGLMVHGGGSLLGWPGSWNPKQRLVPTLGCVRLYNIDLRDKLYPLYKKGTVFVSVYQEPGSK